MSHIRLSQPQGGHRKADMEVPRASMKRLASTSTEAEHGAPAASDLTRRPRMDTILHAGTA